MTRYLISFDDGAMIFPEEELADVTDAAHAVMHEAKEAGVWVFGGGLTALEEASMVGTDGTVTAGSSWIDQSPVTGESIPAEATPGSEVFGGTLNGPGTLTIQVTKPYQDTVLARVIDQVERAQARRGTAQRFADKFGAVYTPIMFTLAALVAVAGPSAGLTVRGRSTGAW